MGEVRPGRVHYTTATKAVLHNYPSSEDGFVGVARKQQAYPAGTGLGAQVITQVQVGEAFIIELRGLVRLPNPINAVTFAKGDPVYITPATNALAKTGPASATNLPFGRVEAIGPERGLPTGFMRVNMDSRDNIL
jgi:hypothetical protein